MDLLFRDGLACPACLSYHLSPTTVPSLLHRPKLPFPPSCLQSADKKQVPPLTTTKAKRGVRHRNSFFIVHRRNSPVCWLKVQHTEYRIKKRGNREREETSWGPKLQTKNGKRFPHARGIFANTMQNRQLVCLKRTPINNRKHTPSIPLRGLRAQEKKRNQNAFWHFKIFGTLVITFFTVH